MAIPLAEQIELISLDIREPIYFSARPVDLDAFSLNAPPKTEVCAKITLGKVTSASSDFPDLRDAIGNYSNACSHSIAIALGPNQFEIQKMVGISGVVKQRGQVVVVGHNNIH